VESEWDFGGDNNTVWSEDSDQFLSKQQGISHFYLSFANILIPCTSNGQLDANKELQEKLPVLLANILEIRKGERESIMESLLGPPQLSSALCLLQIVVYLYSNHLLGNTRLHTNNLLGRKLTTIRKYSKLDSRDYSF
jgi:hypothetical protein